MRRRISAWFYLGEPLLLPTPWFVIAALIACMAHSDARAPIVVLFALLALAIRCTSEVSFARHLRDDRFDGTMVPLVLLKDAVVLAAWVVGWFKTTAAWRGTEFRIGRGSVLSPLTRDAVETEVVHGAH